MGFLNKVKNAVTGGEAEVHVEVGDAQPGESVPVKVQARAKGEAEFSSVYLLVRATEKAEFTEVDFDDDGFDRDKEKGTKVVFDERFDIAGGGEMEEGDELNWEATFDLPASANPTFRGEIIANEWTIQAGLDAPGNDPDSGWQTFTVG